MSTTGLVYRVVWCGAAISLFVFTLLIYQPGHPLAHEALYPIIYGMWIIGFPVAFLAYLLFAAVVVIIYKIAGVNISSPFKYEWLNIFILWGILALAGYWQWFILFPKFWHCKNRQDESLG